MYQLCFSGELQLIQLHTFMEEAEKICVQKNKTELELNTNQPSQSTQVIG